MREPIWRRVLRFWKSDPAADIDDELRHHQERRIEEFTAQGMSRAEAEAAARVRFGDERAFRDELLRMEVPAARWRAVAERLAVVGQELRFGVRALLRAPEFAAAVVVTMAIGVGVNAAMFGVLDRVVLSPPSGVRDAGHVGHLYFDATDRGHEGVIEAGNYPGLRVLRAALKPYGAAAGYFSTQFPIDRGEEGWNADGQLVTANYFSLLGARPRLGRFFTEDEERPGVGDPGLVISYGVWTARFGGADDVLGRRVWIRGHLYPVVGVAPAGFTGAELGRVDMWLPLSASAFGLYSPRWDTDRFSYFLRSIVRLRPDAAPENAIAAMSAAQHAVARERDPSDTTATWRAALAPLSGVRGMDMKLSPQARVTAWLSIVALIVLVIACANVANLFLLRALARRREIAIRQALGVGRAQLATAFLGESVLLALVGCAAALVCVWWIAPPLRAVLIPRVAWVGPAVNLRVVLVGVGCAMASALVAGLMSLLTAGRLDVGEVLKMSGPGLSVRRSRLQGTLAAVQSGLSLLLLVAASLFVRSLQNARTIRLGFDPDRVLVASVAPPPGEDKAADERLLRSARERLRGLPGVESVARGLASPFGFAMGGSIRVPGEPPLSQGQPIWTYYNEVTPDFFATLGMRVERGRTFTEAEEESHANVAVVSARIARTKWPGRDPIGQCFWRGGDSTNACTQVVGVVEDAHQFKLVSDSMMLFYVPLGAKRGAQAAQLFVRTRRDAAPMIAPVRRALQALSPASPWPQVESMRSRVEPLVWQWKLGAWMFPAFGSLALVIAGVGLYSVLAYSVTLRASELAIRSALGAERGQLLSLVLGTAARMVGVGLALGTLGGIATARLLKGLLLGMSPLDPASFAIAAVALSAASLMASLAPAWRAAKTDPVEALRTT